MFSHQTTIFYNLTDYSSTPVMQAYQNAFSSGISNSNKPAKKFMACGQK